MKQLVCEMCGGHELQKEEGVFVCQSCGCKYSVEEAKKLMIEGNVDVSGSTVKVDDSGKIENFELLAENAYMSNNLAEAENYCNKIIELDPENYNAWLIKGKAAGWQSTLANVRTKETILAFATALTNAPEDKQEEIKKDIESEVQKMCVALGQHACDHFSKYPSEDSKETLMNVTSSIMAIVEVFEKNEGMNLSYAKNTIPSLISTACVSAWKNTITKEYNSQTWPSSYDWERFTQKGLATIVLLKWAIEMFNAKDSSNIQRYKNIIIMYEALIDSKGYTYRDGVYVTDSEFSVATKEKYIDNVMNCHNKIKELDPSYEIPAKPEIKASSGGCYVATAVYGSYDCPQVWPLRRYRAYTLAQSWYGRAFIHTYYAISPTLVKWFGHTEWFKKMWKGKLDRMVANLKADGVEDTPYEDRKW